MDKSLLALVEAIHASPVRCALFIAGAGASSIAHLTAVPGCSRTLLEARVPYASAATAALLDDVPSKYVSAPVARQLAQHAYHTARRLALRDTTANDTLAPLEAEGNDIVGIGATSAVQTDRVRCGAHLAYVASWRRAGVVEYAMDLSPELSRDAQEAQVALLVLRALSQCAAESPLPPLSTTTTIEVGAVGAVPYRQRSWELPHRAPLARVLCGEWPFAVFNAHGECRAAAEPYAAEGQSSSGEGQRRLLFPGSFRPLHWGHTELARAAVARMMKEGMESGDVRVTYEIALQNADKGSIESEEEVCRRVRQFTQRGERIAVTNATLFTDKAEMFPGHGFIVGIDTARRIVDPKYYGGSQDAMMNAVRAIGNRGGYFVVGGRATGDMNEWEDISTVAIPGELRELFIGISQSDFRVDVSSTFLRQRSGSGGE